MVLGGLANNISEMPYPNLVFYFHKLVKRGIWVTIFFINVVIGNYKIYSVYSKMCANSMTLTSSRLKMKNVLKILGCETHLEYWKVQIHFVCKNDSSYR